MLSLLLFLFFFLISLLFSSIYPHPPTSSLSSHTPHHQPLFISPSNFFPSHSSLSSPRLPFTGPPSLHFFPSFFSLLSSLSSDLSPPIGKTTNPRNFFWESSQAFLRFFPFPHRSLDLRISSLPFFFSLLSPIGTLGWSPDFFFSFIYLLLLLFSLSLLELSHCRRRDASAFSGTPFIPIFSHFIYLFILFIFILYFFYFQKAIHCLPPARSPAGHRGRAPWACDLLPFSLSLTSPYHSFSIIIIIIIIIIVILSYFNNNSCLWNLDCWINMKFGFNLLLVDSYVIWFNLLLVN